MAKISFWVEEGVLFSGVAMLMDAFSIANLWHRSFTENKQDTLFQMELLTTDGEPVDAYGGLQIKPHRAVNKALRTDCLIIAPILPNITPMPGNLAKLTNWVHTLRNRKAPIATSCTGTFILAEMGFLDGKTATTNWQYARMFQKRYPEVKLCPQHMMTEDDGILCTGAATAVYHLGLHLIRLFGSNRLACAVSKSLLVDPNRTSQLPYLLSNPLKSHGDSQVLTAQQFIEENYAVIDSIDTVARKVGISPRHFKRRFKSATGDQPIKYLQQIRIDAAREKLETTRDTIEKITLAVGYNDISSFCRLFKQHTKISPKAYRDRFFLPNAR